MRLPARVFIVAMLLSVGAYVAFRQTHAEIWERDKRAYVIFPESYGRPLYCAWAAAVLHRQYPHRDAAPYRAASVRVALRG